MIKVFQYMTTCNFMSRIRYIDFVYIIKLENISRLRKSHFAVCGNMIDVMWSDNIILQIIIKRNIRITYHVCIHYSFQRKVVLEKKNAINLGKIYNAFIIRKKRTKYAIRKNKYFLLWNINRNILNVFRYAFSTLQQTNASRFISIRNA